MKDPDPITTSVSADPLAETKQYDEHQPLRDGFDSHDAGIPLPDDHVGSEPAEAIQVAGDAATGGAVVSDGDDLAVAGHEPPGGEGEGGTEPALVEVLIETPCGLQSGLSARRKWREDGDQALEKLPPTDSAGGGEKPVVRNRHGAARRRGKNIFKLRISRLELEELLREFPTSAWASDSPEER